MEPLFSVGSEIIVLAERVAGGALMSLAGPMFELRVSGGSVRIAANVAKETFVDGMTVEAFATAARAVLASEGPLRIGPTSERLRAEDVAAIDAAIGKRAAWLFQGFPPSYDASNSSWYVSAYLPADHVTSRLRRGTVARVLGAMVSREAYDQRKKWTLTAPQAYAQVLEPGTDDPLAIAGPRDRQRPFRVYGEFTDDDLLAIVDLIRSAPTLPSKTGEPPQSVIFHHVRGSWPMQTISADEIGIKVTLLDESPAEKTGQGVHLQKADGKWTVIRLTAWIAD